MNGEDDRDGDREDAQQHSLFQCPACGRDVHLVASHTDHQARWVCLACKTVGSAPFTHAHQHPAGGPTTPPPRS